MEIHDVMLLFIAAVLTTATGMHAYFYVTLTTTIYNSLLDHKILDANVRSTIKPSFPRV